MTAAPPTTSAGESTPPAPRLIVAASETDANMLYATGFHAPDAFCLVIDEQGRKTALLSELEIDRARANSSIDECVSSKPYREALKEAAGGEEPTVNETICAFLHDFGYEKFRAPDNFPLGLARKLRKTGITVTPVDAPFFPEREIKTEAEIALLRKAIEMTEKGLARGLDVLREASIEGQDELFWHGSRLTSEILRAEIDSAILRLGGLPQNTIVAGGEQACDPHERGHGQLYAHQLIIIDVFPRDSKTGYYGDLTRTVIKGQASAAQRELWEMTLRGQEKALREIKPNRKGLEAQDDVKEFFTENGYPTEEREGRNVGFFHGLGHGLGLDLHESPRISRTTFTPGQVFTVEPGLYYPGIGGVRHEDIVLITKEGCEVLSTLEKPLTV